MKYSFQIYAVDRAGNTLPAISGGSVSGRTERYRARNTLTRFVDANLTLTRFVRASPSGWWLAMSDRPHGGA